MPTSSPLAATGGAGDPSGRDRIRDAAIAEFAARGVAATSLKVIAARAGVSPALIVHHFGSKDALREACDAHVAAVVRERKYAAVRGGSGGFDPLGALRSSTETRPLLRYLARTLGDGRPQVAALVDEMIEDCLGYVEEGVRTGMMQPSRYPRQRAAILVLWSLGMMTLHEHVHRHLDTDLFGAEIGELAPYLLPAAEILEEGVLAPGMHEQLRHAFVQLGATLPGDPDPDPAAAGSARRPEDPT
ncbi:TetR/AcrR family transcriptional regulator [Nitriliruptoraceae bacterium ZYF776]|nr:TetR/AcrR family transcriptional regulator [Profundirhabdus halotolerans]